MNYNKPDVESEFDYYPELPINMQSPSDIERTVNNTVYAVRDGSVMTVMPDSLETYGSTFVSPVSRMMCVYDKGEMVIIQKFDSDRILGSDLRPIKDDYIVTVLPHQYTDKFRDRIHNSEGRKFVEMSTADFLALSQFITSNPDVQTRVKPEKIQALIRGNDIDERMLDEFSGDNILISDEAITKYFETNDREQNKYLNAVKSMHKYEQPENIDDYESGKVIDGKQGAIPRQLAKEKNVRYGAVIDESELDISQVLLDRERGMSKQPEYRGSDNKGMTNFSQFRSE